MNPNHPARTDAWINTIQMYRFPLALAVVVVHAGEFVLSQAPRGTRGLDLWLVEFLTMLSRLATPSFLVIAGFLFFRNGPLSQDAYRRKLKARFHTLLLPYLAWNAIAVLLFCAPPALRYLFLGQSSCPYVPCTVRSLAAWFIGWPIFPADAPMWFVRDLLLLVAVAPLLSLVPQRAQLLGLSVLGLYWLAGPRDLIPGGIPRAGSAFFLLVGAWMGTNRIALRDSPVATRILALAAGTFVGAAALSAGLAAPGGGGHAAVNALLEKTVRISGSLVVICAAMKPVRFPALSGVLLRLSPASFFLFAFHYCALVWLAPFLKAHAPLDVGSGQGFVFLAVLFTLGVVVSMACYFLLRSYAPSLLAVLDGNRSAGGSPAPQDEKLREAPLLLLVKDQGRSG